MTDKQTRELNASNAGTGVMDANIPVWTTKASIASKVIAIKASQVVIFNQNAVQQQNRSGTKTSKEDARKAAGGKAWEMAQVLETFALDAGNDELAGEVKFTESKLNKGKDSTLAQRWQVVHDAAGANQTALTTGGYLIDASDVTDLQALIDDFADWQPKPVMGKVAKKTATTALKVEFAKMKKNIELMFGAIGPMAKTNTDFYNSVSDGFEVLDSGNRHEAGWFTFVDDLLSVRLPDVTATNTDLGIVKKGSKRGVARYSYEELGNGNFNYTFVKPGYTMVAKNGVKSEKGKLIRIEIRMVKI